MAPSWKRRPGGCQKRGWHHITECDTEPIIRLTRNDFPKSKKLRLGLLNTQESVTSDDRQKPIMERNRAASPLLRLPPEVRNRIYEFVLGGHRIIVDYTPHDHEYTTQVEYTHNEHGAKKRIETRRLRNHFGGGLKHRIVDDKRDRGSTTLHLGLLRVCRQVYEEAALLPYVLNSFVFCNQWVMKKCMWNLRPAQKLALGKLEVLEEPSDDEKAVRPWEKARPFGQ